MTMPRSDRRFDRAFRTVFFVAALVVVPALGAGCRGQTFEDPPVAWIRNMHDQPRYDPQERSYFFEDGRTMRHLVEGVVAREMEVDPEVYRGRTLDDAAWVLRIPSEIVDRHGGMPELVSRGQERYGIYCSVCHNYDGKGNGMAVQRGMVQPPSLHDERIRHMPDGQLYGTIANGVRNMPGYSHAIPVNDRWAIVGYVRALQLSQSEEAQAMNLVDPKGDSTDGEVGR